jgi:hypothetical protein
MKTDVTEIADRIYRLSTLVPQIGPNGFTFNQFLIDADQPLLFHYGHRAMFPLISAAVASVMPLDKLRWLTCSHGEADESGALNEWLAAAPKATPAHGMVGCNIWLRDSSNKDPRVLKERRGDRSWRQARALARHTAHAALLGCRPRLRGDHEHRSSPAICFTQVGAHPTTTDSDIVAPSIATEQRLPYLPVTASLAPQLRKLAALKPRTMALMHGPAYIGDGGAALTALADHYGAPSGRAEAEIRLPADSCLCRRARCRG